MNEFDERVLRSVAQLLVNNSFDEVAALVLDMQLSLSSRTDVKHDDQFTKHLSVTLEIPFTIFDLVNDDERIKNILERAIKSLLRTQEFSFPLWTEGPMGAYPDYYPDTPENAEYMFKYQMVLLDVEADWKDKIRDLIVSSGTRNQGIITELAFSKNHRQPLTYNEMSFASQTEVRIAQEFEKRKVLFFPLPLAVRADSGNRYKDHREIDFLVCQDGTWGILEVSGAHHQGRYEQDKEKDAWFKQSGILCIEHFTSERAYRDTTKVVDEFLSVLEKHKR